MDWGKLLNGLGTAGDVLAGKESYNSALRGQQQNATANRQIGSNENIALEDNKLKKLLQELKIAADVLAQDKGIKADDDRLVKDQVFRMGESAKDRGHGLTIQGNDINARRDLSVLNNDANMAQTLAPLNFQEDLLTKRGYYSALPQEVSQQFGIPVNATPANLGLWSGAALDAATMNQPMARKEFGNSLTQMEELRQMNAFMDKVRAGKGVYGTTPGVSAPSLWSNPRQPARPFRGNP